MRPGLEPLLHILLAAGVAEPSTLVIAFSGDPIAHASPDFKSRNAAGATAPRAVMSSRISRPEIRHARFFAAGLDEEYVTYELIYGAARPEQVAFSSSHPPLGAVERLAFGLRFAADRLREQGVPVRRYVVTGATTSSCGSIDHALTQRLADAMNERISVRPVADVEAAGAAILERLRRDAAAAGRFYSQSHAIRTLAGHERASVVRRRLDEARRLGRIYEQFAARLREEADPDSGGIPGGVVG